VHSGALGDVHGEQPGPGEHHGLRVDGQGRIAALEDRQPSASRVEIAADERLRTSGSIAHTDHDHAAAVVGEAGGSLCQVDQGVRHRPTDGLRSRRSDSTS
jgi:hypothetical protein